MSVGASIAGVWHNHPYVILGAGGLVVAYMLWPSSSAPAATGSSGDPQLAAQTSLAQSQIAAQLQSANNTSNNATSVQLATIAETAASNAAMYGAQATSNSNIAQANAAAIVSYNQTAQAQIAGNTAANIAQTQAASTDFQTLAAGLSAFGAQNASIIASNNLSIQDLINGLSSGPSSSSSSGKSGSSSSKTGQSAFDILASERPTQSMSFFQNLLLSLEGGGSFSNNAKTNTQDGSGGWGAGASQSSSGSGSGSVTVTGNGALSSIDLLGGLWAQLLKSVPTAGSVPTQVAVQNPILPGTTQAV